ncbi:hypothetical protein PAN31117_05057 [Pandoraea anapnoica]|uniref:Uncharacterized protein n=1 Tax=Pandoraea anapnoica TaxID=2508301 RepID=A0A5E5AR08_9BURK|nr:MULTISPECIES: hypothetical protein [Pandoraea]VVE58665.1 hypothetical protein PIN31009_05343 [Pandoraea iniqua]VVE75005.1 hypothetical protein PAN31117_05057 [Pandoraea anapnoica]
MVNLALLVALISTHPNPEAAAEVFVQSSDQLISGWLALHLPQKFIDSGIAYRDLLLGYFS